MIPHIYNPQHFLIEEFMPPDLVAKFPENKLWRLLDARLLWTADRLKERYEMVGAMSVNTYLWGGPRKWSGFRSPGSPHYSLTSGHSHGVALDAVFRNTEVSKIQDDIQYGRFPDDFQYITELELDVNWLHISVRNSLKLTTYSPQTP